LESQHQLPECRSPERQAGTAGHHLAVGLLPGMRSNRSVERGLSRTGTLNCGAAALVDKEKESSGTTGATRHPKAPRGLHGFFSPLSSKDRTGFQYVNRVPTSRPFYPSHKKTKWYRC